jgi:hypothetical protein
MHKTGQCACGAIHFEITKPQIAGGACHCTDCQKASGGGANYVVLVPKDGFEVTKGTPAYYRKAGNSGGVVARAFCGTCGTPMWSEPTHEPFFTVKVGTLDDSADFVPQIEIFTASAPAWHLTHADIPQFAQMPPAPES